MLLNMQLRKGLTFWDFWQNDGVHRSPLQFLYFCVNTHFFHLNTQIEIYSGSVVLLGVCILLYRTFLKTLNPVPLFVKILYSIGIPVIVYNLNQWELLAEQFALSFASRLLLFLASIILTDRYFHAIDHYQRFTFELGLFYIIVVLLVGGGYFPALILSISAAIFFDQILRAITHSQLYWKEHLYLFISLCMAASLYLIGTIDSVEQNIGQFSILNLCLTFVQGIVMMLGVAFVGSSASTLSAAFTGTLVSIVIVILAIIYFKEKLYKKTYAPIAMVLYFVGTAGLICLGRNNLYGVNFAFSSRYVCETNIALLGLFWLACLVVTQIFIPKCLSYHFIKVVISTALGVVMVVGVAIGNFREIEIAPSRGAYYRNLISMIVNADSLTSEDFLLFQADESDVRLGIAIMNKYHLGYFYKNANE